MKIIFSLNRCLLMMKFKKRTLAMMKTFLSTIKRTNQCLMGNYSFPISTYHACWHHRWPKYGPLLRVKEGFIYVLASKMDLYKCHLTLELEIGILVKFQILSEWERDTISHYTWIVALLDDLLLYFQRRKKGTHLSEFFAQDCWSTILWGPQLYKVPVNPIILSFRTKWSR